MPSGRRSFNQISLNVTGAQSFQDRFPETDAHDENLPAVTPWRCNVTGLSHVYNLYFVAYTDSIYVYQPQFPSQAIHSEPALIINTEALPVSVRLWGNRFWGNLRGSAIRGTRTINRLLVQFLGNEEVIAVVRDDGDVEAYYTRHIQHAIERRTYYDNTLGVMASDIRPYFHKNVGDSAWGLAIHTKARMIAVSANSHAITVFTFALVDSESADDVDTDYLEGGEEDDYYVSLRESRPPNDRKKSDVRILVVGTHNIPDIAFCNSGDDPSGRWLLAADITGDVTTWDVHSMSLAQRVHTYVKPPRYLDVHGFNTRNANWGIMFLDPLSFRSARSVEEALAFPPASSGFSFEEVKNHPVWDLGATVDQIPGVREPFKNVGRPVEVQDGNYANPLATSTRLMSNTLPTDSPRHQSDMDLGRDDDEDEDDSDEDEDNETELNEDEEGEDLEDSDDESDDSLGDGGDSTPNTTFAAPTALCGDLPCPIMQLSVKDIYLYQPSPNNTYSENLPVPAIGNLFAQDLHTTIQPNNIDRINMHAQIPSLGAVIVATQLGRIAVLSLTKTETQVPDYASARYGRFTRGPQSRVLYGFRVDHVLPLPGQEAAGHRPRFAVHGIAVGPVQGTEHLDDDLKRWRLLVMYQNHAMLTYEIGRPKRHALGLDMMEV